MKKFAWVGVDVSAKELVVALERSGGPLKESSFSNDGAGHRKLIQSLTRNGFRARVCVEATGVYHLDLCLALHGTQSIEVMVVNPRAAKDFHRAQLQRSKTDRVDARSLLEFLRRMDFVAWEPPRSEILHLRGLSRRIQALLVNRAQEKNRRHADGAVEDTSPAIGLSIERHITAIEEEMKILSQSALDLILADAQLAKRFAYLTSVKGIANASAITILAELAVLPADMTVRQWVAHAGIDPRCNESGSSVRGQVRISKVGNRHLRRALFLPAMVASQHEPQVKAYYQHLLERGKKPLQALVAVMRKLLHAIYGMFKNERDFDGAKFYAMNA
jgi:transposase